MQGGADQAHPVKAVCKGTDVTLTPPFLGQVGVILTAGTDSKQYCAAFGGTLLKNDIKLAKCKDAVAPGACPSCSPPRRRR